MKPDATTNRLAPDHRLIALRDVAPETSNARRDRLVRLTLIAAVAIAAHAAGIAAFAWLERFDALDGRTAGVEIPVEVMGEDDALHGDAKVNSGKPASPRPGENDAQSSKPLPEAASQQTGATKPDGVIVERPRETELPQQARTRHADNLERPDKPEETGNPFGSLATVVTATDRRAPAFVEPRAFLETRPTPAPDPTNDNYRAKVLTRVAESMIEPERPRPKALSIVSFTIDDTGALTAAWLARPSGYADLDAEAMEMVKRAAPFPAPPAKSDRDFAAAIAFGGD
jgi:periplasmic protein TonB